ncbi:GNAT family N-acetyltransferase [uncultured Sulfitobacter sp.]|jgi:phosphinothricin acetyltransferase|uniref:GNAT family N-acetyltransferase n=1 Tax=Sulfitobacter sp. SH22 TaxID=3421172 RepID=UPI0025E54AE4|nr:GNAT family N-acetyltransferase [uncultured Sulfitobacter sp.]
MTIRAATQADAAEIAAIWNDMIRNTLFTFTTEEKTETGIAAMILDRPGAVWVAQAEAEAIAGFVTYAQFRSGPGYRTSVEHSIVLGAGARGQGTGRALMDKAIASAAGQGHHVMVAGISAANAGGVAFHTALGFQHVGRMPEIARKGGQWLDLILMQKMLSAP